MARTKVVHIITKLDLGGAQQNTLFTVAHLNSNDYKPVLISGTEGLLVEDAKNIKDLEVHLIPELVREIRLYKDLIAILKIRRILKRLKQEDQRKDNPKNFSQIIVHTHSAKAGILGRWATRLTGIKHIIHSIHGFSFNDYQPSLMRAFYILLERVTSAITEKFIAVSKANIRLGLTKKMFTSENVVLIRSGIDIESYQKTKGERVRKRKELGFDADVPVIAMIACFKPQKSPLDFIRVAKIVSGDLSEALFIFVGDGVLRPRIEELIKGLEIENKVALLGWRRDIPEIMSAIDVLVLTSLWEGLPRVLPQAMASGIPIVATNVDGSPEAVINGENGFLLKPGDISGIARKIIYLIKNPEEARKMGLRGKELVEEYDIWRMLKQQEDLYASLLK